MMPYKIDPEVLATVAKEVVGQPLAGGEIASQIDFYDLESDETTGMTLRPGEHTITERGHARGMTIHPGSWHIEYGRGAVVTTLPFAMVDTLLVSLELESVRRSTVEFVRLASRRLRR